MAAPVLRLALAVAGGYTALGAAIQVLPAVVSGPSWWAGAAITAASATAVVARPLAGRRADGHGPRGVVLAGGALAVLGGLAQVAAPSAATLIAARLLIGAGEGALFTGAITWVLAATAAERRGRIVGRFGLSMWGGLAAGPPLAAALAAATSPTTVLWACAALPLLTTVPLLGCRAPARAAVARGALVPDGVARPALVLALASFGYGTLNAFLVLRFEASGFAGAGVALGVLGGTFLLARLLGSGLVDRWPAGRLVAGSAGLEAVGFALIAVAPGAAVALAGVVLCGAGTALVYPTLATLVANGAEPERRGAAVGALTSSWDVGIALAGPAGGALVAVAGLPAAFVLAAVTAGAAAGVMLTRPVQGTALLALER